MLQTCLISRTAWTSQILITRDNIILTCTKKLPVSISIITSATPEESGLGGSKRQVFTGVQCDNTPLLIPQDLLQDLQSLRQLFDEIQASLAL